MASVNEEEPRLMDDERGEGVASLVNVEAAMLDLSY